MSAARITPCAVTLLAALSLCLLFAPACENDEHFLCDPTAGDPESAGCFDIQVCAPAGYCTYRCDPKADPRDQDCSDYETCSPEKLCVVKTDGGGGSTDGGRPCQNGRLDTGETDVDCGGSNCNPCAVRKACVQWTDCEPTLVCTRNTKDTASFARTCHVMESTIYSENALRVALDVSATPASPPAVAIVLENTSAEIRLIQPLSGLPPSRVTNNAAYPSVSHDPNGSLIIGYTNNPASGGGIAWSTLNSGSGSVESACGASPTPGERAQIISMNGTIYLATRRSNSARDILRVDRCTSTSTAWENLLTLDPVIPLSPFHMALAPAGGASTPVYVIALSDNGTPGPLKTAYLTDSGTAPTNAPIYSAATSAISVAVSGAGQVFIAYHTPQNTLALREAGPDATSWSAEDADLKTQSIAGDSGLALAIDKWGTPHLVYRSDADKALIYAYRTGGVWTSILLATLGATPNDPTIAFGLDPSGYPHVAYVKKNGDVVYIRIQPN